MSVEQEREQEETNKVTSTLSTAASSSATAAAGGGGSRSDEKVIDVKDNVQRLYEPLYNAQHAIELSDVKAARIHQGLLLSSSSATSPSASASAAEGKEEQEQHKKEAEEKEKAEKQEEEESNKKEDITVEYVDEARWGCRAIILHNVFSQDECQQLIELTNLVEMKEAHSDHRVRKTQRVEINSDKLAEIFFDRVRPFVENVKVIKAANADLFTGGERMIGDWELVRLNPHFRLCYYNPGGHFSAHFDGVFEQSVNLLSIKTCMAYLNDDYENGTTDFLREHQLFFDEQQSIFRAPEECVLKRVKAKRGDVIVFDHKILHSGSVVEKSKKYILRTELIYKREKDNFTEQQRKAREYLMKAEHAESVKDGEAAIRFYKMAFKLDPTLERTC